MKHVVRFDIHISVFKDSKVPQDTDFLIVGGGIIGFSVAYWLRQTRKFRTTVVERDPTYSKSATALGLGSIRQQFSEAENIQMSLFTSRFLIDFKENLSIKGLL